MNNNEYQTLILAALLHDVGKFMQRAEVSLSEQSNKMEGMLCPVYKGIYSHKHVLWTNEFFEEYVNYLPDGINKSEVANLASYHHNPETPLQMIITNADYLSARERRDEGDEEFGKDAYKKIRMRSVFEEIELKYPLKSDNNGKTYRYELNPLAINKEIIFPKEPKCLNPSEGELLVENYNKLWIEFREEFEKLPQHNFNIFFNSLYYLLEKYTWSIPSSIVHFPDISLFDHLSTTSAIAACLYQYHYNNLQESEIKKDDIEKFLLVGGDLSGIQQFIFEFSSTNPKKLSKTLRGRSFYLSLLTETVSFKILKRFNLPVSCRIMNAGGHFILLVPNIKDTTQQTLEDLVEFVERWFLETFLGKLSLNLDYSVTLSGNDFKSKRFKEKLEQLHLNLELKENQRFKNTYFSIDGDKDKFKTVYHELVEKGTCGFCGIYSAIKRGGVCNICDESANIGDSLVSKDYIGFSLQEGCEVNIAGVGIDFFNDIKEIDKYLLVEKITDKEQENDPVVMKRFVANYIPDVKEGEICEHNHKKDGKIQGCNALCNFCQEPCDVEDKNDLYHLTFQCIATHTIKENNGKGVDHLALLKADVDFLGLIFSMGIEDLSVSRYATLARMLNLFFTGWIRNEIRQRFNKIYIVYSGGDDLLLIGPWEITIEFAKTLNDNFKVFVGENPNITLSSGIALSKPNSPIGILSNVAEENLSASKNTGRNKLTVFDTTVDWQGIENLLKFKDFLNNEIIRENINSTFLYRLLKYHKMFLDAEEGRIEGLRFHSLMARDIKRNIEKKDDKGEVINQDVINRFLPLCAIVDHDKELMKNIKIPIHWVLYKNRGGE